MGSFVQSKGRKRDYRSVAADGTKVSTIDDTVTPALVVQTNDVSTEQSTAEHSRAEHSTAQHSSLTCLRIRQAHFCLCCGIHGLETPLLVRSVLSQQLRATG